MRGLKLSSANILLVISLIMLIRAVTEILSLQHDAVLLGSVVFAVIVSLFILKAPQISNERAAAFSKIIGFGCFLNVVALIHIPLYAIIFTSVGVLSGLTAAWLIRNSE